MRRLSISIFQYCRQRLTQIQNLVLASFQRSHLCLMLWLTQSLGFFYGDNSTIQKWAAFPYEREPEHVHTISCCKRIHTEDFFSKLPSTMALHSMCVQCVSSCSSHVNADGVCVLREETNLFLIYTLHNQRVKMQTKLLRILLPSATGRLHAMTISGRLQQTWPNNSKVIISSGLGGWEKLIEIPWLEDYAYTAESCII